MRATSRRTIACQAHSIFAKTAATGRYALIRKAMERTVVVSLPICPRPEL